jgi:protein TonB
MVRSLPLHSETRPELPRVLAIAAAIAVHAFAFLLLLIPLSTPMPQVRIAPDKPDVTFIEPEKKIIEKPVQVEAAKPVPAKPVPARTTPAVVPETAPPVIVEGGSVAATSTPTEAVTATEMGPVSAGPISVSSLAYVSAPPPPYPRDAVRDGAQGTVLLKILVDVDGTPLQVVVQESSGNRSLDRTARDHVLKHWRFQPAMRDGHQVQAYGLVPINFTMQ